ncbi:uncharacterized protein LOC130742684 [Lotus japonicus]|uniref:uncharacterized protein LOC130742684 n=1 Tax=Lotus japonicus TaxID=34305 RepID=UPI00258F5A93|nr:uncharacterized protein LOC130742684 [Lotus japonicus]
MPNGVQDADDGYLSSLENLGPSREEDSADSEDDSVGATYGLAGSQGNLSQGVESQRTGENGKRITQSKQIINKKKLNCLLKDSKCLDNSSIGEVMTELQTIEEVSNDIELHTKCCLLMMHTPARDMFVAMRGVEEKMLHCLKVAANNP